MKTDTICLFLHLLMVIMNAVITIWSLHSNTKLLESMTEVSTTFERALWRVAKALGAKGVEG